MRSVASLAAFAAALPSALAAYQGFNYGSTFTDGSPKAQSDFEADFKTAASLDGTGGAFTSARLYTMVQGGTANDVISAVPAAISTKTSLLLGLWASGGDGGFANELAALKAAISTYGDSLGPLVAGISVGSEDLYRVSPTGILNKSGYGATPDVLVNYISQVRAAIANTPLSGAPVGHVDTWTAWVNGSNDAVIDAVDFLGVDAYPYFQSTEPNGIDQGAALLNTATDNTAGVAKGKPVWVTETGWPVSGDTSNLAVPSPENAKTFWDEAGCPRFGNVNIWWFTLQDADPTTPNPSFGIIGSTLTTTPIYDLSCASVSKPKSSAPPPPPPSTPTPSPVQHKPSSTTTPEASTSTVVTTSSSSSSSSTTPSSSPAPSSTGGAVGVASSSTAAQTTMTTTTVSSSAASSSVASSSAPASNGTTTATGGASATGSSSPSSTTGATVPASGASVLSGQMGAGIVAILAAIMLL
ncbi:hypothetical protein SEPCBS119000_000594 [Sporothrix epigloea]|uniref:Probable glucan endo-1,3-beta-glucosidase eglC n=1 Tax=Sporothrix epigloea TaxID=1892477 RepID=A0ABP0D965_9PEZI